MKTELTDLNDFFWDSTLTNNRLDERNLEILGSIPNWPAMNVYGSHIGPLVPQNTHPYCRVTILIDSRDHDILALSTDSRLYGPHLLSLSRHLKFLCGYESSQRFMIRGNSQNVLRIGSWIFRATSTKCFDSLRDLSILYRFPRHSA